MKTLPLALAVLAGVTYSSPAALTVTGGDFEAGGGTGDILDVPYFFESSTASYNYDDYTTYHADHFSVNHTRKLAFDHPGQGYVYQSLGVYSGELSLTLQCDSLIRDAIGRDASTVEEVTFSLWDVPVPADGHEIGALTGAVMLDSFLFDASAQTYTADTYTFQHTYDISGATEGDEVWLQIKKGGPGVWEVVLDNLEVVPEPSSLALLGLAGAAGLFLRRRRA